MRFVGRRCCGFSLVELLVVIGIIGALTAIIFPVISRARHSARKATCLANLHQLHVAMMAYKNDYDGFLPLWSDPPDKPEEDHFMDPVTWDDALVDYTQTTDILICPSNPYWELKEDDEAPGDPPTKYGPKRSYALPRYVSGVLLERIPNPVETVLLAEKGAYPAGHWADAAMENVYQMGFNQVYPDGTTMMFHFGGKNFLSIDGHARWFKAGQGPFAWDSGRTGNTNCGPGVCEVPALPPDGDWPPLE